MRPIDADKVMEEINRIGGHNLCEWDTLGVKALICRQPTADVVPRAEVDRIKADTAREIFEEIETVLYSVAVPTIRADGRIGGKTLDGLHIRIEDYNTIKKKYTEDWK